jgi:glycogen synthase
MDELRVLTVTSDYFPTIGGIISNIKNTSEELVARGHTCTVLAACEGRDRDEIVKGVRVIGIKSPLSRVLFGYSLRLCPFIQKGRLLNDADIIHVHGYHSLLSLSAMRCIRNNRHTVFSPHYHAIGHTTIKNLMHKVYRPVGRKMFKIPERIICNSLYESGLVQRDFGVGTSRIELIPPGVKRINHTPKSKKSDLISLLYVGYVREYKGVQFILGAMRELLNEGIETKLEIVGKGEYEGQIRKLIAKLDLEEHIEWSENISEDELERRFIEATILLLPSKAEAYGLVVAEALALGTPCIVSNSTALKEFLIQPGCYGIDYPPDVGALADLIAEVNSKNWKVGPLNQSKIRTWGKVAKEYEEVYMEVIDTGDGLRRE